jgi:hypothetical protein
MWRTGRIIEAIQSNDGQIRSVKLRIPSGNIISRPVNLVYPLEFEPKLEQVISSGKMTEDDDKHSVSSTALQDTKDQGDSSSYEQEQSADRVLISVPTIGCGEQKQPVAGIRAFTVPSIGGGRQEPPVAGVCMSPLSHLPPATEEPAEVPPTPTSEDGKANDGKNKDTDRQSLNSICNSKSHCSAASTKNNIRVDQFRNTQNPTLSKTKRPVRQAAVEAQRAWRATASSSEDEDEEEY